MNSATVRQLIKSLETQVSVLRAQLADSAELESEEGCLADLEGILSETGVSSAEEIENSHYRFHADDISGIAPSSPESDPIAEFSFELAWVHSIGIDLDRIDGIQSCIDQIIHQLPHAPATVEHDLDIIQIFSPVPQFLVIGLDNIPIHLRGYQRTRLTSKIIAKTMISM